LPIGGAKAVIKGVGLLSMAHRAHVLGGKLEMRKLKHGFKIVVTIPVH
jgi:signal transduction histidine kinase